MRLGAREHDQLVHRQMLRVVDVRAAVLDDLGARVCVEGLQVRAAVELDAVERDGLRTMRAAVQRERLGDDELRARAGPQRQRPRGLLLSLLRIRVLCICMRRLQARVNLLRPRVRFTRRRRC